MHGQVEMMLVRTMNESFLMYKEKSYVADGIDFLQANVSRIVHWLNSVKTERVSERETKGIENKIDAQGVDDLWHRWNVKLQD